MSSLIVEICEIKEIKEHTNADALDIAVVKGWEVIVPLKLYRPGDKVIFVPVDSLIPVELSDKMGITKYLAKEGRVRTAKLRGEYSQGVIIDLKHLLDIESKPTMKDVDSLAVGTNVASLLGIIKYEPPVRMQMSGDCRPDHPGFFKYTNIENYNNFPDIFQEGEIVSITEKIHGTNFRVANIAGELFAGSHNSNLKPCDKNLYWRAAKMMKLDEILQPGEQIFGEIYGDVQELKYGFKGGHRKFTVAFLDLMINNRYVHDEELKYYLVKNDLSSPPLLYYGPWSKDLISLAEGNSIVINADNIREGMVIKPIIERWDENLNGRVILKIISKSYALKQEKRGNKNKQVLPH